MKCVSVLRRGVFPLLALVLMAHGREARADLIYGTAVGAATGGGAVKAEADFTLGQNTLTIALRNLQGDPGNVAQLISGVFFDVTGPTGSVTLASVNSGRVSTINVTNGTYTPGEVAPLSRWVAHQSGSAINLTMFSGGKPSHQIIGPDNLGNFNPALGGRYDNANASIGKHNPVVLGLATFVLTVPGVTPTSVLSNVVFKFGTANDTCTDVVPGQPRTFVVPEPASLVLMGLGVAGLGVLAWRRPRVRAA